MLAEPDMQLLGYLFIYQLHLFWTKKTKTQPSSNVWHTGKKFISSPIILNQFSLVPIFYNFDLFRADKCPGLPQSIAVILSLSINHICILMQICVLFLLSCSLLWLPHLQIVAICRVVCQAFTLDRYQFGVIYTEGICHGFSI